METKKEDDKKHYELVQVPTEFALAFKDNLAIKEEEAIVNDKELLLRIANDVADIKRQLSG
jgi:hypothetical protein